MNGLAQFKRSPLTFVTSYDYGEQTGIAAIVIIGCLSIAAVIFVCVFFAATYKRRSTHWQRTHLVAYIGSLMVANVLQAIGAVMNARWVALGGVVNGEFCRAQGGIKNVGNNGTALWSFMVALHLFNLLFLRWKSTPTALLATLIAGWTAVIVVTASGPLFIQTVANGSYFGPSGLWCWITDQYPAEQEFLEYFFEFLSAGFGFMLYVLILLRVRGNLVIENGWLHFQWVSRSQAWQLSVGRDMIDSAMLRVAMSMVWYPVVYSLLIIPVALARISTFTGHHVPFWATVVTDVLFNSTGLLNSILFMSTRNALPDTSELPEITAPRQTAGHSLRASRKEGKMVGVTPFELPPVDEKEAEFIRSRSLRSQHSRVQDVEAEAGADYLSDPQDLSRPNVRKHSGEIDGENVNFMFDGRDFENVILDRSPQASVVSHDLRHERTLSELSISTLSSVHSNTPFLEY